ncbi:MAG: ferrous iron transport protein B [Promethearchaeota archaeon]
MDEISDTEPSRDEIYGSNVTSGDALPTFHLVLAGNANVGKSVIFNQLTGMSQFVGNWPGKTVTWAEGNLVFNGRKFNLVDLPGIYSLSTFSIEEIVSREYIVEKAPDFIVNVLDASNLERNLFFTIQLLMLERPMVVVLNQIDVARRKGLAIDTEVMSEVLGHPVLTSVAVHGRGVHEILETVIDYEAVTSELHPPQVSFGKEVEERIERVLEKIAGVETPYPDRFAAVKLLERDEAMLSYFNERVEGIVFFIDELAREIEDIHGEDSASVIASEIYSIVQKLVARAVTVEHSIEKAKFVEKLDHVTSHSVWGYVILAAILFSSYWFVFTLGSLIADAVDALYSAISAPIYAAWGEDNPWVQVLWGGAGGGFFGAVGGVLPFVFLFYFIMELLQDSGYLPRAAYLMDHFMHKIGVHGKTIIPIILGFGCNVPGCTGCRIMETEREKDISIFVTSLVPCAAVTTVVLGLVGRYLGIWWAFLLYGINFLVIMVLGRAAHKFARGEPTELIIELHEYRRPNFNVVVKQTWFRGKEFVNKALPLIVVVSIFMEIMVEFNLLAPVNQALAPVTVVWLGLPVGVGIFLLYGILRKELTLILLAGYAAGLGLLVNQYLDPVQMITFALVTMLYIPCLATIVVIGRESGWKKAGLITAVEIGVALLVGGLVHWGHELFTFLTW